MLGELSGQLERGGDVAGADGHEGVEELGALGYFSAQQTAAAETGASCC